MERDERVMVLGEDVGKKGGVFGATEGLFAKYGEKRVLDTPLTEAMIAGAATGAAMYGLRPVAEMQFADFVYPAFNQIVSEISRMPYRSNGTFGLPMVIRMPYGGGVHGALYHSQSNEAYFTSTVGLKVVAPGTPADAKGLLKAAIRDPDPVMYFEHKKTYRLFRAEVPDGDTVVPIGKADVARDGKPPLDLLLRDDAHLRPRGGGDARPRGRHRGGGRRSAYRCARSTRRRSWHRWRRRPVRSSSTRPTASAASAPRWPHSSASRASSTSTRPVTRLAGPEVPGVPFHHDLEDWFMINPAKIVAAARSLAAY